MFSDRELETTVDMCEKTIIELLDSKGGSDLDYICSLQTAISLKDSAERKLQKQNKE
jgi:hypothetical protein